ncbi:MAG: DedA family protein [Nitrospinota bacterium]|nr:MAG: DedA family protein [Nitrospinota bacterium]
MVPSSAFLKSTILPQVMFDFSAFITNYIEHFSYGGLLAFLILAGLGLPFPEEITLAVGGALIAEQVTTPLMTFLISLVGIVSGDCCLYMLGKRYGEWIFQHRWFAPLLTRPRVDHMRTLFERYGKWVVLVARFISGVRVVAFFTAGSLRMPLAWFLLLDTLGAILFAPFFLALGYTFADHREVWLGYISHIDRILFFSLAVLGLLGLLFLFRHYYSK